MAGCSKKQYAIMMGAGNEGKQLASKMGSMEQGDFNKAFADLLQSDAATDVASGYKQEEDEDFQEFDNDNSFEDDKPIEDKPQIEDKPEENNSPVEDNPSVENNLPAYKSKYASEDFEDARFYPVTDEDRKNAGPKYLGRYHSIYDAAGLNDNEPGNWKKERDMFKYVGDSKRGASIVQGPDGYFSGNPRINSMSFKTQQQAADWLDEVNPDEHMYGVYFKPGDERQYIYRDSEDKYDLEAPDAYKNARNKYKYQEISNKTAKMPNGKDMKLTDFAEKIAPWTMQEDGNLEIAATIIASKYGLSENEALNYLKNVHHTGNGGK